MREDVMRLRDIPAAELDGEQARVLAEASGGKRGRVPAPLRAWVHSPAFGDRAQRLGEFLRYDTSLGPRLAELAILVTARYWTSQYEWFAHKREALKAGLEPAIIDAIAARRVPDFADEAGRAVHEYAKTLHETRAVPQAVHDAAVAAVGERGVVELVGLLGYYTLVSMTLNAFEIGLPPGEPAGLEP